MLTPPPSFPIKNVLNDSWSDPQVYKGLSLDNTYYQELHREAWKAGNLQSFFQKIAEIDPISASEA